jgi:hypothetical protein
VERIYLNFELTEDEYVEISSYSPVDPLYPALAVGAVTGVFLQIATMFAYSDPKGDPLIAFGVGALMSVMVFGLAHFSDQAETAREMYRTNGIGDEVRCYLLEETCLTQIYEGQATKLMWSMIDRWYESESLFRLKVKRAEVILPKRCTENPGQLRGLFERTLGRRDKLYKSPFL